MLIWWRRVGQGGGFFSGTDKHTVLDGVTSYEPMEEKEGKARKWQMTCLVHVGQPDRGGWEKVGLVL